MKFTQEELHELNQMIDLQINRLFQNMNTMSKDNPYTKYPKHKEMMNKFLVEAVKNYDLLNTIRAKVNKNG